MAEQDGSMEERLDRWQERVDELPTRKDDFTTLSGHPLKALYTSEDLDDWSEDEDLGAPGQYPFTRGPYATMYRTRPWTMRQFAGFGSAEDTNRRYKYLLEHGQTGLSVAFDMPTLMGLDSDDPLAEGEVGRCGVAVSSLADMETLFDGIPLDEVSTSMTINGPAAIIWAFYIAAAEKQGADVSELRGTLQNDILKEYIAQKEYIFPPHPSMRIVVDTIEFATRHMPQWYPVSISGYHIREAGSTAAQELAFTLADGLAYVDATLERGLDVDEFAPRLSFFFNAHSDFFEEIAKYRAARRIWARHLRDEYGAEDPRSWRLRFHTQTAGCSLTAQQPENNIVRVAIQALSAVLGGTQSLHTNSMDETHALPTAKAAKIALRTQQVILEETGAAEVIDPLGGSYFVERLTDEMDEKAEGYFTQIEDRGGVIPAIEDGWFQREIGDAAYRLQREYEAGERHVVGVTKHVEDASEPEIELLKIGQDTEETQVDALRELREERSDEEVERAIDEVKRVAEEGGNLMPSLVEAAKAYATLGELTGALKAILGEYREVPAI